jgi:hypothetical protein
VRACRQQLVDRAQTDWQTCRKHEQRRCSAVAGKAKEGMLAAFGPASWLGAVLDDLSRTDGQDEE